MGCGYGVIGIVMGHLYKNSKIYMVDVVTRAVALSLENVAINNLTNCECIVSDGYTNFDVKSNYIVMNPPIRIGKEKLFLLYSESKNHLLEGGIMYLVIRKKQGSPSHIAFLMTIFKKVTIIHSKKGYNIIKCE
jgi:16S rRNA (guanine1207-N2)-methyltransferase